MRHCALIVLVTAVAALYLCEASPHYSHYCGPDKIFNKCGIACPPTCEDHGLKPCTMQCVIGCQCREGLYKHKDGSCIHPSMCPPKEPRNHNIPHGLLPKPTWN